MEAVSKSSLPLEGSSISKVLSLLSAIAPGQYQRRGDMMCIWMCYRGKPPGFLLRDRNFDAPIECDSALVDRILLAEMVNKPRDRNTVGRAIDFEDGYRLEHGTGIDCVYSFVDTDGDFDVLVRFSDVNEVHLLP